jgi:flagellar hook-basal body complex protein FliE
MNAINPVSIPTNLPVPGSARPESSQGSGSFKDLLLNSIQEVNTMQQAADRAVEQLAVGGDVNPAEVLTAVQKADIAFRMMMQIRNKIVQAYQEVQNIRI